MDLADYKLDVENNGFTVIDNIYNETEIEAILDVIENVDTTNDTFRKSADLFAIRQFLKEVPNVLPLLLNHKLKEIIATIFGENYFIVKSIYFDKPGASNWFVAYHQDLTISVDQKANIENFGPWTVKQEQFAVQPPLPTLENIYTIRIHLDATDENNGALKVIPQSHSKQIYRPETINWNVETEVSCNVGQGGLMIMKPLLLHSSGRTTNNNRRRVLHIEFSSAVLPAPLQWAEKMEI
ncbi:phytanoyl-CoA dioxygenase family protein [Flavobacterium subsaxonicum]|uniref:Phytanoyl-CoA dioxygenase n=1 Tax=Flavobacterium subsaxonicum WB 4.1-42 = DSM 21790 TaxID=1121898 RepID=A0A0A2MQ18_9FLAO|nr:phytanoyl-CoA dioxygenase family protein [Flavobacterium subsaxonicum]KGO94752.1 phytanoyl-CoA dioxygenase [Flavobacterium subsaxonicum WB 4.1-42 = DSM 21790]